MTVIAPWGDTVTPNFEISGTAVQGWHPEPIS